MKLLKSLTLMFAMLLAMSLALFAAEGKQEEKKEVPKVTQKDTPKEESKELIAQTHCPVMGGVIDSSIYTDIQGQRVYHCCPMCSAKLKKDPDTYFKKAAANNVLFENIQTTCPVSGKEFEDKSVYTDFEGRRIVFCCKKCRGTFNEDPHKFLSKMDTPQENHVESKEHDHDHNAHTGHNH